MITWNEIIVLIATLALIKAAGDSYPVTIKINGEIVKDAE
jgi:hypothetical protein